MTIPTTAPADGPVAVLSKTHQSVVSRASSTDSLIGSPRLSKAGGSPMLGNYNRHSEAQRSSLLTAVGTIEREFARMQLDASGNPVTSTERYAVADFGCSTGANSIPALEAILRLAGTTPVDFYLVDLPGNDWATTADALTPLATSHNISIVHDFPAPELAGMDANGNSEAASAPSRIILTPMSFFDAVFPPNTLHMSFSGTAMHWLSNKPKSDGKFGAGGDPRYRSLAASDPVRAEWDSLQKADWETLLRLRADELVQGGSLVVVLPCANYEAEPRFGKICASTLADAGADLCARGLMTEDQVRDIPMAYFLRSKAEIEAPFTGGALAGSGMRLTDLDMRVVETPGCRAALMGTMPRKEYADGVVNLFAAFSTNVWEGCGLSKEVIAMLLDGLRKDAEKQPLEYQYLLWQAYVVVRKEQ